MASLTPEVLQALEALTSQLRKADGMQEDQDRAPGGDAEDSAKNAPPPTEEATQDPKSLFFDPFAVVEQMGFKDRASQISYGTLRSIVWKVPIISTIIQTRINQLASFCVPQRDKYQLGFKIALRDYEKQPTGADKDWCRQMETIMMRTGVTNNPRGRGGFEKFIRQLAWDSLTYDQMAFEVVPNRKGQPAEWYAVDASTIRLADTGRHLDEDDNRSTKFVQIYDSVVIADYNQEELCFGVRNPRTDMKLYGYGVSETEMVMTAVTSILWAWQYNSRFFSQGSAVKGMLNFKGAVNEKQLRAFRRHWYTMLSGVENAWRTPITNSEDVQWINLQANNRDMEFNAWMDFLIKVACGIFTIAPEEINFRYGNAGNKGSLSEASNKEKITESKERGLRPLLRFFANAINQYIIWPTNENFEFRFVGLDAATRDELATLNQKRAKTTHTVNELRAEEDLPPLPDEQGNVILDPTWVQWVMQNKQAEEGVGDFAAEAGPGEGEDDEQTFGDLDFEQMLAEDEANDDTDEDVEKSFIDLTL